MLCKRSDRYIKTHCNCHYYNHVDSIGPYCSRWENEDTPFCYLSNELKGKFCPGAVQRENDEIYWTEDEIVCNKSRNYVETNCNCAYYDEVDSVGPYCSEWVKGDPPFCYISGRETARFCPGATLHGNESIYWTEDTDTCQRSSAYVEENCKCHNYEEEHIYDIGPHCSRWYSSDYTPFCLLSGRSMAKFCPGATPDMYIPYLYSTTDNATCERSNPSIWENCSCEYRADLPHIAPFCSEWNHKHEGYCILSGGNDGKFCAGATLLMGGDFYWTDDREICMSSLLSSNTISWKIIAPMTHSDIWELGAYSINILLGTIGNALVIKHFASSDGLQRPASRFVIILAGVDFLSSIWIPGYIITRKLYFFPPGIPSWPFGEYFCRIAKFYPFLFYATSWLLLAISLERARAIYQPFADKLKISLVLLLSSLIILASVALEMYKGLRYTSAGNQHLFIYETIYEYYDCINQDSDENRFANTTVTFVIGVWLPMSMIATIYGLFYMKLKQQAQIRRQNSSQDSRSQMMKISRTFTVVVLVYFICYLPHTILNIMHYYSQYANELISVDTFNRAIPFTNFLIFSNSCLNPLIYSKIHVKIHNRIKHYITRWRSSVSASSTRPKQETLRSGTSFVIPSTGVQTTKL